MSKRELLLFETIYYSTIYIAEEMGIILRNTAYSPNIRDRLDFSCAVLTPGADLIAQAEHIPVHLGSMAVAGKLIIEYLEKEGIELEPGDVIIVNDPYLSGTHLNDVTLLKPVFKDGKLVCYLINKAHHVDVGGITPGSISADARELSQEGLVIPPTKIVRKGELNRELLKLIESNVRVPRYTRGDLMAQIASLNVGEHRVLELVDKYGIESLQRAWNYAIEYVEKYTRAKVSQVSKVTLRAVDYVEFKNELFNINVEVKFTESEVIVDFTGTHRQVDYPINAVYGVTVASVTFSLKCVLDPDLPMNSGFYRVVKILAPVGTIVNPVKPAPVGIGPLETSQRIVDVMFRALSEVFPDRVPAASQGTMNNVLIGGMYDNTRWVYYETIAGGMGARPCKDGVDAVHTGMTNTMNTPVEVIEREYPLQVLEYSLRVDSAGLGKFRGGLGIVRKYRLVKGKARLTVISSRVLTRPWGLQGGEDGLSGKHIVIKRDGKIVELSNIASLDLEEGDVVVIQTPGGGGFGNVNERSRDLIRQDLENGKVTIDRYRLSGCTNIS